MAREKAIDIVKGIGILLVVWDHFGLNFHLEISIFHMPLFFFISGFWHNQSISWKKMILNKTKRLLVPAFSFIILFLIFYAVIGIWDPTKIQMILHNWNVLYPSSYIDNPIWFLFALFNVTLMFQYISLQTSPFLGMFCMFCLSFLGTKLPQLPFYLTSSFVCLPFFALGFYYHKSSYYNDKKINVILFIIAVLLYSWAIYNRSIIDVAALVFGTSYMMFFLPALGGIVVIFLSRFIANFNFSSILEKWGNNSLGIMGIHNPLQYYVLSPVPMLTTFLLVELGLDGEVNYRRCAKILFLLFFIILFLLSHYISLFLKKKMPRLFG
ncbi:MAG: acyltransferase family protein [Bacteroides ovatus]|nr:acyltransferase family protein [Bacteroides ovatus]